MRIESIRETLEGAVSLEGHVHRQGKQQFQPGMRLTDLIGSLDELQPRADLHYVLIRRESGPERKVSVVSADLAQAFAAPQSAANVALQARDRVHVFDLASSRDRVVAPIIEELARQSSRDEPMKLVGIGGRVKAPGQYPLEPEMRVSDLLRAGGSLDEAAYVGEAELTRYAFDGNERRQTELIRIDLQGVRSGNRAADVSLQAYDYLVIKEIPEWYEQETVTIAGEVRFPGTYPIQRGETLRSVLQRAGGLTDAAFPEGGVFTRRELQEREQRQLVLLADRLQRDLATLALQGSQTNPGSAEQATQVVEVGRGLLEDLRRTEAVGRLVLDLPRATSHSGMEIAWSFRNAGRK
jgi:polysaccharide biosynthesis/export protein